MPQLPFAAFTFGDGLLTVVELAFFFLWIWIAVGVVFDVFRSHDLSNASKALWVLFIFVFPLLGVLGYLIVRGHTMHEHQVHDAARFGSFGPRPRDGSMSGSTSGGMGGGMGGGMSGATASDLGTLADLRDRGVLTPEEFESAKAKVLA